MRNAWRRLKSGFRALCALFIVLSLLVQPTDTARAQQAPTQPTPTPTAPKVDQGLVQRLGQDSGGSAHVEYHRETGMVRFIGTDPGQPIKRAAGLSASASSVDAARGFMATYGPLFGVKDQSRELTVKREKAADGGRSIVRFAQQYNGIPVFAGEVIVHLDKAQNVQVATGELLPNITVDTTPTISKGDAQRLAAGVVAKETQRDARQLKASDPELQIYNRGLIGDPGPQNTTLVWRMDVTAGPQEPIKYLVLVNAQNGVIALKFNQIADARNRLTYTLNHGTVTGTLVCNESNPTCAGGDADAVAAHVYAGATYDFYQSRFGRDSIDGAGLTIKSFVHYSTNYQNAFWDGFEMVYGDGFSEGDDVVGHELTHGVTQYESGLLYFRQSGAINESLSDVFGELIDLTDGQGNDSAGVRWLLAEDLPIGAIRNMANPPQFGDPDRVQSGLFWAANSDSGGVHSNSGVNNKAAFLMTDGGSFNGRTITGLGIEKVARIYYEVQTNLLTPGSDYADLYNALQQACFTLIGTNVTTSADCAQVLLAVQATEMNLLPTVAGAPPVVAPVCPTGQTPSNLFFDDLENTTTTTGNFTHGFITGGDGWEYPPPASDVNPTSGTKNFHAIDRSTISDFVLGRSASITLPANAFLRFNHSWNFDNDVSGAVNRYWDGGILEYSTDSGATWFNASPLIAAGEGGYTGTLRTTAQGSDNPLQGQQAWVGNSGYGSTRVNLASLAGQSFRFRFRVGTDSTVGLDGWYIDDIRIYTCAAGSVGVQVTPTSGLQTTEAGGTATFTMALTGQPTANVTVNLSSSNPNEGVVGPGSIVFTPGDWSNPKTVTVKGVPDAAKDGNVPYTIVTSNTISTDPAFNNLVVPDVSVTNVGNCDTRPRIVVSNSSGGAGVRNLTITAPAGFGLFSVQVTNAPSPPGRQLLNASVDFPGVGNGLTNAFVRTFSPPQASVSFTIHRTAPGNLMVPMIITDNCGPWPYFFGSGPNGF
ncbi:MAG: M4 family metallopeptidase [Chloroflexota bacterium]